MMEVQNNQFEDKTSQRRLIFSIILNLLITAAEVIGGVLANSLALLSDALHNFSDSASLGVSLATNHVAQKKPNQSKTFGYKRAEIIGAFINLVTLTIVALYLIIAGLKRLYSHAPINGYLLLGIVLIGLAGNVITAMLLFKSSRENINIKSAFFHIVSDSLSSIGVIAAGIIIMKYRFYIADTIITLAIAGYILVYSFRMFKNTINILMESVPSDVHIDQIEQRIQEQKFVQGVHHVHVWNVGEH